MLGRFTQSDNGRRNEVERLIFADQEHIVEGPFSAQQKRLEELLATHANLLSTTRTRGRLSARHTQLSDYRKRVYIGPSESNVVVEAGSAAAYLLHKKGDTPTLGLVLAPTTTQIPELVFSGSKGQAEPVRLTFHNGHVVAEGSEWAVPADDEKFSALLNVAIDSISSNLRAEHERLIDQHLRRRKFAAAGSGVLVATLALGGGIHYGTNRLQDYWEAADARRAAYDAEGHMLSGEGVEISFPKVTEVSEDLFSETPGYRRGADLLSPRAFSPSEASAGSYCTTVPADIIRQHEGDSLVVSAPQGSPILGGTVSVSASGEICITPPNQEHEGTDLTPDFLAQIIPERP